MCNSFGELPVTSIFSSFDPLPPPSPNSWEEKKKENNFPVLLLSLSQEGLLLEAWIAEKNIYRASPSTMLLTVIYYMRNMWYFTVRVTKIS